MISSRRQRTAFASFALALLALGTGSRPIQAQSDDPAATAEAFLRAVRAIRWDAASTLLAEQTLRRFAETVSMIVEADTSGEMAEYLTDSPPRAVGTIDHASLFARSIGAVIDDMPGLMHSIYDRDDEIIGAVHEDGDRAHVVYRTTARISGAVPEVKVMQLGLGLDGWRVVWSDELEVLDAALRGVTRRYPGPTSSLPADRGG